MKAEIVRSARPREFEPFDLVIRVETADEAFRLWHRFNVGIRSIVQCDSTGDVPYPDLKLGDPLDAYEAITAEIHRQGLNSRC
jgi:hypothetical protein